MNKKISLNLTEAALTQGLVCVNSGGRSARAVLSEALTSYAAGYKPSNVRGVREFIAPTVSSPERFEYQVLGKGSFLTEKDVVRSIGGDFKRIEWSPDKTLAQTLEKGLTMRIDRRERTDNCEEEAVEYLINRLDRIDLVSAYNMLAAAAGAATAKKWTGADKTPPDTDIKRLLETMAGKKGVRGNRVLVGSAADMLRSDYYEQSANNSAAANYTPEEMAKKWGVERVHILVEMIQDAEGLKNAGDSSAVIAFFAQDAASRWDASTLKTFTSGESGEFAVFREEVPTGLDITVWHSNVIVNTMASGAAAITAS